jgi:exonuclease 3'-5' domain-containing protein 1
MSTTSAQRRVTFINVEADLQPLLDSITNLAVDPPSLYINLEGIELSCPRPVSILSLYIAPAQTTYLIDVYRLGKAAFSTTNNRGTSLKTILESRTIPKVAFDIRLASHVLFRHFQVSVDGMKDLQLMELAFRKGSRQFLASRAKCIEKDGSLSAADAKPEWRRPEQQSGRYYGVFHERPLTPEITQFCEQGVVVLPGLYKLYNSALRPRGQAFWRIHVRDETQKRIKLAQSPSYDGKAKDGNLGWNDEALEDDMEAWNEDIMMEAAAGQYVLNENDDWVPAPADGFDDLDMEEE